MHQSCSKSPEPAIGELSLRDIMEQEERAKKANGQNIKMKTTKATKFGRYMRENK
jgi:hypothetical protein